MQIEKKDIGGIQFFVFGNILEKTEGHVQSFPVNVENSRTSLWLAFSIKSSMINERFKDFKADKRKSLPFRLFVTFGTRTQDFVQYAINVKVSQNIGRDVLDRLEP